MNKQISKKVIYFSLFAFFALLLLLIEVLGIRFSKDDLIHDMIYGIITRLIGSVICILMICFCSYGKLFSFGGRGQSRALLLTLPAWLIAINNFPFIPVISGNAVLEKSWGLVFLYAIQCLLVGLFEECAFRGCVFMLILEGRRKTRKDVFWSIVYSSLVFGAIHIVNLFAGAGIIPVVLQLGYSFLIGAMCALVLLVTKRLWTSIFLHALFNFAGGVIPTLGAGHIWDTPTVILTVVISLAVLAYMIVLFARFDLPSLDSLFSKNSQKSV